MINGAQRREINPRGESPRVAQRKLVVDKALLIAGRYCGAALDKVDLFAYDRRMTTVSQTAVEGAVRQDSTTSVPSRPPQPRTEPSLSSERTELSTIPPTQEARVDVSQVPTLDSPSAVLEVTPDSPAVGGLLSAEEVARAKVTAAYRSAYELAA